MEEKRPGQDPEADRPFDERSQASTARPGGLAKHDPAADEEDRRLIHDAEEHAKPFNEQLRKAGFGDHMGVEGF